MLCFRSSRDAGNLVHETFLWFTANGRATAAIFSVLAVGSLLTVMAMTGGFSDFSLLNHRDINLDLSLSMFHFGDFDRYIPTTFLALCEGLIVLVTALTACPLLMRYFRFRRSLRTLSWSIYRDSFKLDSSRILGASLALAALAFINVMWNAFFALIAFCLCVWLIPLILMPGVRSTPQLRGSRLGFMFGSLILTLLMMFVIVMLPYYILFIIRYGVYFVNHAIPGTADVLESYSGLCSTVGVMLNFIAIGFAMIYFLLASILIYGKIQAEIAENK